MSGGFAYVLDADESFEKRVNHGMVELEAISMEDAEFLAGLLDEHRERTGSVKAKELLSNWERAIGCFVKVVPMEYRRVLAERERPEPEQSRAGQRASNAEAE
jgi:glutamate synthase domain-containing protein 3